MSREENTEQSRNGGFDQFLQEKSGTVAQAETLEPDALLTEYEKGKKDKQCSDSMTLPAKKPLTSGHKVAPGLLAYMQQVVQKERNGNAQAQAEKLQRLFGDSYRAFQYLRHYKEKTPTGTIHDACLFSLPNSESIWDRELWCTVLIATKYEARAFKLIALADKLERGYPTILLKTEGTKANLASYPRGIYLLRSNDKDTVWAAVKHTQLHTEKKFNLTNLLKTKEEKDWLKAVQLTFAENWKEKEIELNPAAFELIFSQCKRALGNKCKSPWLNLRPTKNKGIKDWTHKRNQLETLAASFHYKRANENPEAAKVFHQYGMTEAEDIFNQYLALVPVNNKQIIPSINFFHEDLEVALLSSSDPRAALLGVPTGCCQSLGSHAEDLVKWAIQSPDAGFYVVKRRSEIVAQALAWRVGNVLVLDSIEMNEAVFSSNSTVLPSVIFNLGYHLVGTPGIEEVRVGTGGATPEALCPKVVDEEALISPIDFDGYRDSEEQARITVSEPEFCQLSKSEEKTTLECIMQHQYMCFKERRDHLTAFNEIKDNLAHSICNVS